MRIAICTPGSMDFADYRRGNLLGTEYQVWGLSQVLASRGHEMFVLRRWQQGSPSSELIDGITIVNVTCQDLPDRLLQRAATKARFSARLLQEVKAIEPDGLILTDLFASLFVSNMPYNKIYVAHNPPTGSGWPSSQLKEQAKGLVERFVFSNCGAIVALNQTSRRVLERRNYRVRQIPNAVETDRYPEQSRDGGYILSAGRLVAIKGIHYLIDAYSRLDKTLRHQFRLVILGYGPEQRSLEARAARLGLAGEVEFLGWQPNRQLVEHISNCTLFVLPSTFDTFPVTLIEAMACGKAVVASDIPGPNEIVEHGHDGLLFERGNVVALKATLEQLLERPELRRALGESARKTVTKRFTFQVIGPMYEEALAYARSG